MEKKQQGQGRQGQQKEQGRQRQEKKLSLKEIRKELGECEKLRDEYLAGWQRQKADFINFKRDEGERMKQVVDSFLKFLVLEILLILDNFDLAEKSLSQESKKDVNILGLLQIKKQLENFLKDQGVEEIKVVGKEFDPNTSEAVEEVSHEIPIENASPKEKRSPKRGTDIVLQEIQKGYILKNKVIRPAKVKIAKN